MSAFEESIPQKMGYTLTRESLEEKFRLQQTNWEGEQNEIWLDDDEVRELIKAFKLGLKWTRDRLEAE
jgi:hypothetical protein